MKKKIIINIFSVVLFIGILFLIQKIMMPKYVDGILEGRLISEYYDETTPSDVIFIGDCELYENISPITLWEEYGITSYVRGSAQQLIWQSYYLMEETVEREKPDIIVFNILSMQYGAPQNEAYNRMTLDGMKWSSSKVDSIKASMTDDEEFASYVFPLLRYHSRWNEIGFKDFKYAFTDKKISHNGYLMRVDVKPVTTIPDGKVLSNYEFTDTCYEYLDKMTKLCKDNDIELVLVKAPSIYPHWYDEWEVQMEEYAKENDLLYINFLELTDEVGIDFNVDTYDAGLHLNLSGAEKLSIYLGNILKEEYNLTDHRNDEELIKVWTDKVDFYNAMKADQYAELEEYGYLKSYGGVKRD